MQTYPCSETPTADRSVPAPARPARVWFSRHRGPLLGLGAIAVVLVLALAALPAPAIAGSSATGRLTPISPAAFGTCNPVGTKTPSALLQGLPVPTKNLSAGGTLAAVMEVATVNWTPADDNITVFFPSVFFDFPRATGGNAQLFFSNRSLSMNFSGWSSPSFATTKNFAFPSGLDFAKKGTATIDSMKLAVTTNVDYGTITIEVRWQWISTATPGATPVHGPWSVPTNQANWPKSVPSIFWPAPYAPFEGGFASNATIGQNWTGTLGGDVAGRTFFLEMEDPAGTVQDSQLQTAPANATNYTAYIMMLNYDNYLTPGVYLVHVHDACGAMLWNKLVHASLGPTAQIHFSITPSACATKSITFDGQKFTNGTVGTFAPSTTAYNFSIPNCPGNSFHNWVTTGALHIETGKTMLVSNNGTFTVEYN
jgi:hypothetical protein